MSTHVTTTDKPIYWTAEAAGKVIIADICTVGGRVATPLTVTQNTDANAYLGAVAGKGSEYQPIPQAGERCEAGKIYGYNGGLVICRQSHWRTIHAPEDTLALWITYRAGASGVLDWIAAEQVLVGTHRMYGGTEYECIQAHVTQADWTPPAVAALWRPYIPAPPVGTWAYPVAYKIGDKVTYQGKSYQCIQAHTSQAGWTPPAVPALWQKL